MTKLRVGLLFGGRSAEHEVSLASASSIHKALDPARYDVSLIAVDREGRWRLGSPELPPEATVEGREVSLPAVPGASELVASGDGGLERSRCRSRRRHIRHRYLRRGRRRVDRCRCGLHPHRRGSRRRQRRRTCGRSR